MRRNTSQIDQLNDKDSDVNDEAPQTLKKESQQSSYLTDRKMPVVDVSNDLEQKLYDYELQWQAWERQTKELQEQIQILQKVNYSLQMDNETVSQQNVKLVEQIKILSEKIKDQKTDEYTSIIKNLYQQVQDLEQEYVLQQQVHQKKESSLQLRVQELSSFHYHEQENIDKLEKIIADNQDFNKMIINLKLEISNQKQYLSNLSNFKFEGSQGMLELKSERNFYHSKVENLESKLLEQQAFVNKQKEEYQNTNKQLIQLKQYYQESLVQNEQLQLRIKQCLELISDQELQYNKLQEKYLNEKTEMHQQVEQMKNEKKELEIKLKSFKHKLEQIDKIDYKLKKGLESLEYENLKVNEEKRQLSDEIDQLQIKISSFEVQMKGYQQQLSASEIMQSKQSTNLRQKTDQLELLMNELNNNRSKLVQISKIMKKLEREFANYCNQISFQPESEFTSSISESKKVNGGSSLLELNLCIQELISVATH